MLTRTVSGKALKYFGGQGVHPAGECLPKRWWLLGDLQTVHDEALNPLFGADALGLGCGFNFQRKK